MTKSRTTYHVVHKDGEWKGEKEGAKRASVTGETKAEVVDKTRDIAKNQTLGQVIVHKKNGQIQTEWTYGKDPYPPKG